MGFSLFMLAGCSDQVEDVNDSDLATSDTSQKGRLLFSASSSARAVNPTKGFDFENDAGLTFTLSGNTSDNSSWLPEIKSWSDTDSMKAYAAMQADKSTVLDTGDWTFRLSVTKNEKEVLYGKKELTIKAGDNVLDFGTLSESDEWDAAKGSINFTLYFPKEVTGASAYLESVESYGSSYSDSLEIKTTDSKNYVTFAKEELDAGTYILSISLRIEQAEYYNAEAVTSYCDLVNIAPGLTSEGSAKITDINKLCGITYELNGGTLRSGDSNTCCYKHGYIILPTPEKEYYVFSGWATSENGEKVYDDKQQRILITEDMTFYALWTPAKYTITYIFNDDNAENPSDAVTDFTIETETFDLPIPTSTTKGAGFVGWYTTETFDENSKLTQIEKGKTEDITLYARWTNRSLLDEIESMTASGTIKASGKCDKFLISDIKDALNKLASTEGRENVLVTLDLSEVTGLTELESSAFSDCTNLKGIILPNTVTSIGQYAFDGCTSLENITIPDSVTSIGWNVFAGCINLRTATLSSNITEIYDKIFSDCTSLESITIPEGVENIGIRAFENCKNLTSIVIPDSVTYIGPSAFNGCANLASVTIGSNVYKIDNSAFKDCTSLTSVILGSNVQIIVDTAFDGCKNIVNVTINSIAGLGEFLSSEYPNLESVTIGGNVETIVDSRFAKCTKLESVTIGGNVKTIGDSAFAECTNLANVTIGDNVKDIAENAFSGCANIANVTIGSTAGISVFSESRKNIVNITIGGNAETIGDMAFAYYTKLESVTIDGNVRTIGNQAFVGCTNLVSVKLGSNVQTISDNAFNGCTNITNVTINNDIGISVFAKRENLSVTIGDNVETIGNSMFSGYTNLVSVTIGSNVRTIGNKAFYGCTNLTNVSFGTNVQTIGNAAFDGCTNLADVTIGSNVETIGNQAFYGCTNLASVTIGSNVKTIGNVAFSGCTKLADVALGSNVQTIGWTAFHECESLTSITIPASVTSIGHSAFFKCTNLSSCIFESPLDWWYEGTDTAEGDKISANDELKSSTNAATLLTETYVNYNWKKQN